MTSTNDGKDVKSIQTSSTKGKTFLIELYKFLEARLTEEKDAKERNKHLCEAWRRVHSLCLHSASSTHTHLLAWLQRHTARAVLQTEWRTPERKDDREALEEAINAFIAEASTSKYGGRASWELQLVERGKWFKRILEKPWDHPVLTRLLNPNGTPPTDAEVLSWLKEERGVTFVVRLHTLVGEKCDDICMSLATAVMERVRATLPPPTPSEEQAPLVERSGPSFSDKLKEEAGFTTDIWDILTDIEFVLLHKRDRQRCIALAKQTPLLEAYPLIERLQKRLEASPREKRLWKNAREVAILIAQVVIARCMIKSCTGAVCTALYCCSRLLASLLTARLPSVADALAAQALTARHLHTLAQAVDKQLSATHDTMKPYVCELYVRAITAGMNELEKLKLKTEKESEARSMEKTLASWFVQLGTVLSRSLRIACECTLTAFSLHPSQKMYQRIDAHPPLQPVLTDSVECKEETVKSEFGSWANDSRSQTNLVKTSETLNMKQKQNQANVLSTAILNEGEALGLSPELCQDIAVLLSGPRVKTLSWDMDRTLLLEKCRAYSEMTRGGTRILTRELKYLNIDPNQYQHLPEEKDDDENDPYYGIERGYEHLAVLEDPQDIWDDNDDDPERTESTSSIDDDYLAPRRKKKTKRRPINSDEDSDPLSLVVEAKRTQKKKERPHSKERSKERAKKKILELVDPLEIDGENTKDTMTTIQTPKEPKQKRERKKKEKIPKVIVGKRNSLTGLLGLKVAKSKKKPKDFTSAFIPVTDSDNNSREKKLLTSLKSEGTDNDTLNKDASLREHKNRELTEAEKVRAYSILKNKSTSNLQRPPNNLTKMQYRPQSSNVIKPQTPNILRPSTSQDTKTVFGNYKTEDVKVNITKILEYRRQRELHEKMMNQREMQQKLLIQNPPQTPPRKPAIIRPDISLQTNISPKTVAIPEIPKSYINKEQTEKLAELMRAQREQLVKNSVIHYANTNCANKTNELMNSRKSQQPHASTLKMTDIVNTSYDRLMAEIAERHKGLQITKSSQMRYRPPHSSMPAQKSYNVMTPGQRDYQKFLKEYERKKFSNLSARPTDVSAKSATKTVKKPMPMSRVVPVVPNVPKVDPKPAQVIKQAVQPKKPDTSLTFSRLSYMHKNKQNEAKMKPPSQKPCNTSTYNEISSELDEIIKEHQQAQMKVIRTKQDTVDRLQKQAIAQEMIKREDNSHPFFTNLLSSQPSTTNIPLYQNEGTSKNSAPAQEMSSVSPNTSLSDKDHNDLLNLLRQQSKLNNSPQSKVANSSEDKFNNSAQSKLYNSLQSKFINSPQSKLYNPTQCQFSNSPQNKHYNSPQSPFSNSPQSKHSNSAVQYASNIRDKPSTSTISKTEFLTNSAVDQTQQSKQNQASKTTVYEKRCKSSIETKIINILSNSSLQSGNHNVSESLSINVKPMDASISKEKVAEPIGKKHTPGKNQKPKSKGSEWKSVMCDILKHKTPCRGPNALDVALNKSSFESAFEKSLKEATSLSCNSSVLETETSIEPQEKVVRSKPVITSIQNVIITKKGIKLQDATKQQQDISESKKLLKHSVVDEKLKKESLSEPARKLPQDTQRKQFTYAGPKHDDPFISGIPNSDYDLLEELMDDDLRKEIGELSSDEESYNTAAQTFLKPPKSNENKRVTVEFNKGVDEITSGKPLTNMLCVKNPQSTNDMMQAVTLQPASQCTNSSAPKTHGSVTLQQNVDYTSVHNIIPSCQSTPTNISTSDIHNQVYNNVSTLNNSRMLMNSQNIYISSVPQPAPVQNVLLVGSEIVYGGYSAVQTPVQSVTALTPNAYLVNNAPTMTYMTQYTSPVVIETSISVPAINNITCAAVSDQVKMISNVPQPTYASVNFEPQTSTADTQMSSVTSTETNNVTQNSNYNQKNYKLQNENKATERKVLSEVQDITSTEKINNLQNLVENEISMNNMRVATVDNERVKTKRLAILNRKIYHRCLEQTIPLSYSPLLKVQSVSNEYHITKASPVVFSTALLKEDKQMLSDSEEEKLLAQIKNNLQDLSDAINEVPSPATPDSTESKENKNIPIASCRKIQLRSSTKITTENSAADISAPKKSKANLKSDLSGEPTKVISESDIKSTDNKDVSGQKRPSRRLHSKNSTITTEEKKPTQNRLRKQSKEKVPPKNKRESKLKNKISITEQIDIETELRGSVISKSDVGTEIGYGVENRDKASESSKAKICAFEYITQNELGNRKDAETDNIMQMNEECVGSVLLKNSDCSVAEPSVEDLGDDKQFPEIYMDLNRPTSNVDNKNGIPETIHKAKNKIIDSTNEKLYTNKVRNDVDTHLSDSEFGVNDNKKFLSEVPPTKIHKNANPPNKYKHELLSSATVCRESQTASAPVTVILPKNDNIKRSDNISKAIENSTSQDRNKYDEKHNIAAIQDQSKDSDKDNVDLDMMVTCDDEIVPKLCPTFGNIKMARSKPIYAEQKSNVKVLNDTTAIHDEVKPTQKIEDEKMRPDEEKIDFLTAPHDSKLPHLKINTINKISSGKSVPERLMKKPQTRSDTKYYKTHTIDNVPTNMDNDVVIIDDEKTAFELPILKHDSNIQVANKSNDKTSLAECNNDCHTIQSIHPFKEVLPPKEDSTSNCSQLLCDKTSLTDHYIHNAPQHNSLSASNYKEKPHKESNMDAKQSKQSKQSNVLHVDSQNENEKDNSTDVKLSEIPQDYKDKIRIETLPSSDGLKKSVRVSLPNGRKFKATVQGLPNSVEVKVTLDMLFAYPAIKSALLNGLDCKKLFTMNIKHKIATVSTNEPIRILSSQILDVETFASEHQKNMEPVETIDLLSDDEDCGPPKKPLTSGMEMNKLKLHTEFGMFTIPAIDKEVFLKHQKRFHEKTQILLKKVDAEPVTKIVPHRVDIKQMIPNQYVSGLINDVKNKLASDNKTTSKIIPEVVEIDDSSNDSSYPVCVVPKEQNIIDNLKNVLLKELGVNVVKERFVNTQKKISNVDEDVEIIPPKKSTRRNVNKISRVSYGKSCTFDTLDAEEQLRIKRRKCAVLLTRCDRLVKVHEKEIAQAANELLTPVFDNAPVAITEKKSLSDNLGEMILEEEERSSSPVIELNEMIMSLNELPALSKQADVHVTPVACEAPWLMTKLKIHSHSTNNDFQSDMDNLDDHMVCSKKSMSCDADWRITKLTLHEQNMDQVLIRANLIKFDDDMLEIRVTKVLPLSCEADWFSTKSMLNINNTNKALIHGNAIKVCEDTCNDSISKDMPLSCDANWLKTKSSLHSLVLNKNLALPSARVFEIDEETFVDIVDEKELEITLKKCFVDLIRCDDLLKIYNKDIPDKGMHVQISIADEQFPLSCGADWLNTKPALHLQGVENIKLVRSYPSVHIKKTCDSSVPVFLHSCKATWFTTKPKLHSQVIDAVQEQFNIAENRDGIMKLNVTSLSCKARWFVTKASIHSEAMHNTPFVRSNVSVNRNVDCKPMLLQVNDVPSLVSLVLDRLQEASAKHYYRHFRKTIARPLMIKRKSSSLEKTPACKIPKQNDESDYIIKDKKTVPKYDVCSDETNDTPKSLSHATKCDDNHNMNSWHDPVKQVFQDDYRKSDKNLQINIIEDSFIANIKKDDDINLFAISSSEINRKAIGKINTDCVIRSRSPSPVLKTDLLLAFENHGSAISSISSSSQSSYDVSSKSKLHKNHSELLAGSGKLSSANTSIEKNNYVVSSTPGNIKVSNKNYDDESSPSLEATNIIAENVENRYIFQVDEVQKPKNELNDHVQISNSIKIEDNLINDDKQSTYSIDPNIWEDSQDHDYFTSHSVTSGTELINENTYNQELIYVSPDSVVVFSQDEDIQELEEEIVEMHSNEIISDFEYDMITSKTHDNKCTNPFIDCVYDIKTLKSKKRNRADNETHIDNIVSPEEDCKEATDSFVEKGVGTTSENAEETEKVTQLENDASADSIITKYMKLIQNDSDDFQNVIEYEDPDTGTYYVIPIIRSSQTDTAIVENTIESKVSKSSIIGDVNRDAIDNCHRFIAPSESEDVKKDIAVGYDDIEAKLAEIVGEPLPDDLHEQTGAVCRLKESDNLDIRNKNLAAKRQRNDDSSVTKKKRLKYKKKKIVSDTEIEDFVLKMPKRTYSTGIEPIITRSKSSKRKIDMSDSKTSERKYRKAKNIDYPKFTSTSLSETVYQKEYKCLIDYCSTVKFSYSVPFQREHIDVHSTLKSWPIKEMRPQTTEEDKEDNWKLFVDIEKSEALLDPLKQTLTEEITSQFDENSYTPSNIKETNFNMGFGERSGRVIQELIDGEYTTFSAATLSDVKQLQPLLPSDKLGTLVRTNFVNNDIDQRLKAMRFIDHLHLRERVKAFFEKSKAELNLNWKDNNKNCVLENDDSDWPFGDFTSPKCFMPSPVELTVNVVQVGQLPVSAAAQNPVICDPRVTHVSNASPSQCPSENNLGDDLQTPIKTEYTELTTADITLPLMQEYVQHHHQMPSESQEPTKIYSGNDSMTMSSAEIKSIVKIELMEENSHADEDDTMNNENNEPQQVPNGNISVQYENVNNNVTSESGFNTEVLVNSSNMLRSVESFSENIQIAVEKSDQLAHAMNAAGIPAAKVFARAKSIDTLPQLQHSQPNVTISQGNANNFPKTTSINAMTLQQALAQILPPPLNPTNPSENNFQSTTNPQVLHIVQSNNTQSVINKPNGTQLLHIVQNKNSLNSNGAPAPQQTTYSGLSLVDGAIQQSGNQLLHIVNAANPKNANAGQLLKRVNLLTNLANVQGSNEQKMVQFVCKSTDGKAIQLPHQRSMVLRLQPLDTSIDPATPKQSDHQEQNSSSGTSQLICEKESSPQEMKSRSLYEENYARFVQNDPKFAQNEDSKPGSEKSTCLPKFNQVFGKQVYQDNPDEMESENMPQNSGPQEENNTPLDDVTNPPMLIRKTNQPQSSQPNMIQPIKQTIGPMNIQTMHGGVIYTRQIPVNIGNGQTISLITVPSTELVDEPVQKQSNGKFGNQEDPSIIKIAPTNQAAVAPSGSADDNITQARSNETNPQPPNPQPQPVLTQMRIKLPMLSKAPQMVGGTRVVRPSFFQIQRNVIGGPNQQVYQQLVLTAAPPLGQSIRIPAQGQKSKTSSDSQSSPESQMSSSTLEQLREFDMVLEQVKERSTVQPGSSLANHLSKLKSSPDTTDSSTPSTSNQESLTQVLYSVGNSQPLNVVNFVSRKSTITSTGTSFARSPDSTGAVESPSSSTHSNLLHTVTSDSCASSSCASEVAVTTTPHPKPKKKKPKPSTSNSNPFNIKNTPKPSSQKPLEDEQTTQRILYILAEYKEQVENSPDKDKPAPRRRNNPAAPNAGSSKRKRSSCGSRRRDMSPVLGEDSCRTMGSEDSSCGTSLGECNDCSETHSSEESPKKVVRRLTFEQETQITQTRTTTTTTTTVPQRNVIVTDGQAFAVRGAAGKPATTVLMPANYLLPVSMVKGGQQIAIVTNRGPKLLVGAGESGTGGTLLFQRLIGPGGLKPVLARPGVRHIRLPTAALHNLQAFNIATPASANVQPPDSTASPAPAATPPDLVDTRAMSSPWPDRDAGEVKPERGNSSPECSEPWNLPSSSIADGYGYEEIVRTDNMDRTVLDAIPDRYSPDLEAQRIFDKMFDSDSKKSMYDSRCGYDIDASDDDKAYHQVVHRKDGRHTTRLTHVSAAALRHKYAILEHELRLQKSLSEECEDLGVDSPSASELFPEAELLFAPSPAYEQTIEHCHTPQPTIHTQGNPQLELDDQIPTDHLTHNDRHDELDINLDDVGEMVTVGDDGMTTIPLDQDEIARAHEEFARAHPNTTFHSEQEESEVPPFTIAQGIKGRQITFHARGVPGTVVMAPQTTVISQATIEATGTQNTVKFNDLNNIINTMPSAQHAHNLNMQSVLVKDGNESLTKFDRLLNDSRDLNLTSSPVSAIVHSMGNGTQVIRRVQYENRRDSRYLVENSGAITGGENKITDDRRNLQTMNDAPSERHPELFWEQTRTERKRFDFSSANDKCAYNETNSNPSGIGAHTRLDSVIKDARPERRRTDVFTGEESHPPLRTYPPKRTHQQGHHSHHHPDVDKNTTGKPRTSDRCIDVKDESRRRASNRGVVKRGCHCCNGLTTAPKPKKSRPKKNNDYPHN